MNPADGQDVPLTGGAEQQSKSERVSPQIGRASVKVRVRKVVWTQLQYQEQKHHKKIRQKGNKIRVDWTDQDQFLP